MDQVKNRMDISSLFMQFYGLLYTPQGRRGRSCKIRLAASALVLLLIIMVTPVPTNAKGASAASKELSGCLCKFSESDRTMDLIPWNKDKEDYDYSGHVAVGFDSKTEFVLKEQSGLTVKQGGQEYRIPYDDREVKTRSGLVNHHVEVKYSDSGNKRLATKVRIKIKTLVTPAYLGTNAYKEYKALTRCSCAQAKPPQE